MGLIPRLVGGVEVRERRPKYEGEPRYKRLDFIRSKDTKDSEDWTLRRANYPRSQAPRYGAPWEHPQWSSLPYPQQCQILYPGYEQQHPHSFQHQHQHHGHGEIPAPPLHGVDPPIELPERRQIAGPEESSSDESSSEERVYGYVIRPRRRAHSRPRPSGHTIFGSDSEDDRHSRSHRSTSSIITSSSSSGSSVSRRRGGRHGHRGWGG